MTLDNAPRCLHYPPAMFQAQSGKGLAEGLLIAGVVVQYVGTRITLAAVTRDDVSAPDRRAIAQWLPIAVTALAAVALGHTSVAVALVFGSSVAALSLVLGMTAYAAPPQQLPAARRLWLLVLPAAMLVLLAGFRGSLTWYHALMLLTMGAAFLPLWLERTSPDGQAAPLAVANPSSDRTVRWKSAAAGLLPLGVGAYLAAVGAIRTGEQSRLLTPELLAATVLSPLLLLPALGSATVLAQHGQTGQVITSLCGSALLNLCLLLPIVILINYLIGGLTNLSGHSFIGAFRESARAAPYPLVTWRVDAVVLVLISFALIPPAVGRWLPERLEAMLLVLLYAIYLIAETAVSARLLG